MVCTWVSLRYIWVTSQLTFLAFDHHLDLLLRSLSSTSHTHCLSSAFSTLWQDLLLRSSSLLSPCLCLITYLKSFLHWHAYLYASRFSFSTSSSPLNGKVSQSSKCSRFSKLQNLPIFWTFCKMYFLRNWPRRNSLKMLFCRCFLLPLSSVSLSSSLHTLGERAPQNEPKLS